MMNSGNFNYFTHNLVQTPINEAYRYHTHSEFIKKLKVTAFSLNCIFCSSSKTDSLTSDGSFRRCSSCRKDFKAIIINR